MHRLSSYQAGDYLLHQTPMLLIDEVLDFADDRIKVLARIDEKHRLFADSEGKTTACISIELMAQTVGVWAGIQDKLQGTLEPKLGFLLGGRQCQNYVSHYQWGENLIIEAQILMRDERMASFDAQIFNAQQQKVAEGRLTTYQPSADELAELLAGTK